MIEQLPGRREAVMCRLYDAQKSLTAAKRRVMRGAYALDEISAVECQADYAKNQASAVWVTRRTVIESWQHRDAFDSGVTLTEDFFGQHPRRGLLVTGFHAVQRELRRIFFASSYERDCG